jgi:ATP-dependent Clp protease adapter protein ClpS
MTKRTLREWIEIVENGDEVVDRPPVTDRPPTHQHQQAPVHVPGGSTVVVLNDPYTPFEVAVEAVEHGVPLTKDEALRRMMKAHRQGWAAVASYASKDMAETVADRIQRHAHQNTNYDHYKRHIPPRGWSGPWPLHAEVMDADDTNNQ